MRLDNYTPEVFAVNFVKDSEVFGEETTQAIYEEIFSTVCGKKIKLDGFVKMINEDVIDEVFSQPAKATDALIDGAAKAIESVPSKAGIPSQFLDTAGNVVGGTPLKSYLETKPVSFLQKMGGWFKNLPGKVSSFFGSLKGKSFSEIMQQGMGWLQANPVLALKSAGGIALLFMLIKALKKRGELKRYKKLEAIAARQGMMRESAFDDFCEDNLEEKRAMKMVIEECQNNKALSKLIFD
mgnify:CR=1 FL=1